MPSSTRRAFLGTVGAASAAVTGFAGCLSSLGSPASGTLDVYLAANEKPRSDWTYLENGLPDFERLDVDVTGVYFHEAGSEKCEKTMQVVSGPGPMQAPDDDSTSSSAATATPGSTGGGTLSPTGQGTPSQTPETEKNLDCLAFRFRTTVDLTAHAGQKPSHVGTFTVPSHSYRGPILFLDAVSGVRNSPGSFRFDEEAATLYPGADADFERVSPASGPSSVLARVSVMKDHDDPEYAILGDGWTADVPDDTDPSPQVDVGATFQSGFAPQKDATVRVTRRGDPAVDAPVEVNLNNSVSAYRTGEDGTITFPVPEDPRVVGLAVGSDDT